MPVSVCRPFEKPLATVSALVSLLQKMLVFSLLFLQCFKVFHTVDYLSMVAKGWLCLLQEFMQCNLIPTWMRILGIRLKDDADEDCCFDISLPDLPKICLKIYIYYNATSSTRLTSRTCEPARSSRTGIRSRSSLSWASENQLLMGTACCGWKIYEVGELSIMIVSLRSRPTWERS